MGGKYGTTTGAEVDGTGVVGLLVGAIVGGRRVGFEVGTAVIVGMEDGLSDGSEVIGAALGGDAVGLNVKKSGSCSSNSSSRGPLSTGERV